MTESLWTTARLPTNCRVTAAAALCDYETQKKTNPVPSEG